MFFILIVITLVTLIILINYFGVTQFISKIFRKLHQMSYDKQYQASIKHNQQQQECYICLQSVINSVSTTCNHSFCGECLRQFIKSKKMKAIDCPACRNRVLVISRKFKVLDKQQTALMKFFCKYNSKYSQEPNFCRSIIYFGRLIKQIPLIFTSRGFQYFLKNHRLKTIFIMALYIMAPIDLLPQLFFGPFGIFDDVLIGITLARNFISIIIKFIAEQGTPISLK